MRRFDYALPADQRLLGANRCYRHPERGGPFISYLYFVMDLGYSGMDIYWEISNGLISRILTRLTPLKVTLGRHSPKPPIASLVTLLQDF